MVGWENRDNDARSNLASKNEILIPLENYTKKLVLDKNQNLQVQVKNTKETGVDTLIVDRSPLAMAGLKYSMTLLKVNGEDLTGKSLRELNALLLRPAGTKLQLLVKQGDEAPYEITIDY